jgi:hypothetical protein
MLHVLLALFLLSAPLVSPDGVFLSADWHGPVVVITARGSAALSTPYQVVRDDGVVVGESVGGALVQVVDVAPSSRAVTYRLDAVLPDGVIRAASVTLPARQVQHRHLALALAP